MGQKNGSSGLYVMGSDPKLAGAILKVLADNKILGIGGFSPDASLRHLGARPFSGLFCEVEGPESKNVQAIKELALSGNRIPTVLFGHKQNLKTQSIADIAGINLACVIEAPIREDKVLMAVQLLANFSSLDLAFHNLQLDLSARQEDVARLVLEGKTNKEIAAAMNLSEQAIKYHIGNLLKHFEAKNRRELRTRLGDRLKRHA